MLKGKKTYITALLLGMVTVAYALGYIDESLRATLEGLLLAGGLAALRDSIPK